MLCLHVVSAGHLDAQTTLHGDTVVKVLGKPTRGNGTLLELMSIGVANGSDDYMFTHIAGILQARDGNIWVLDGQYPVRASPPSLRMYDARGRFIRTVARRGQGPGELVAPTGLIQLADGRVLVRNVNANSINVYNQDGSHAATWTWLTRMSGIVNGVQQLLGGLDDAVYMQVQVRADGGGPFVPAIVRLDSRNGAVIDTTFPRETLSSDAGTPFQPQTWWRWSPQGYAVSGVTDRYELNIRVPRGNGRPDSILSLRRNVQSPLMGAEERAAWQAYLVEIARLEGKPRNAAPTVPAAKLVLRSVSIDLDGRIWVSVVLPSVRSSGSAGKSEYALTQWQVRTAYDVIDPGGMFLGRITVPDNSFPNIATAQGDIIWGKVIDADGVEVVKKWKINWRPE